MSDQAQKSEIHDTTADATSPPSARGTGGGESRSTGSNFERGAADRDAELSGAHSGETDDAEPARLDAGGGAGSGVPGGGTDLRTGGAFAGGKVIEDRDRLFPDASDDLDSATDVAATDDASPPGAHIISDESAFGGPIKMVTDDNNDTLKKP